MLNKIKNRKIILIISAISIILTSLYCLLKLYLLNYSLDFVFYMEFTSKLFDSLVTNKYTVLPNGFNLFGYSGLDGINGFNRSIHFEPIKYLFALIYFIFKSPYYVFFFRSIIYFSPILYITFIFPINNKLDYSFIIAISVLFLIFPSSLPSIANDLRPFSLLASVFLLLFLSIYFKRAFYETILFFNMLFIIREEALIYSVIAIIFYISVYSGIRKKKEVYIYFLITNWLVWLFFNYIYFKWSGYGFSTGLLSRYFSITINPVIHLFLLISLALIVFYCISLFLKKMTGYNLIKSNYFIILLVIIPPLYYILRGEDINLMGDLIISLKYLLSHFVFDARYNIIVITLFLFLIISFNVIKKLKYKKLILISMGAIIILCFNFVIVRYNPPNMKQQFMQSKLIYSFKNSISKIDTKILVDSSTIQAFYDFESVFLFDLVNNSNGDMNKERMENINKLLTDEIDYIAVSENNIFAIIQIINEISNKQYENIAENKSYSIIKIL